jgi:hypothetical protein
MGETSLQEAFNVVDNLSPLEKVQLVEHLTETLKVDLAKRQPLKSAYGLWADLKVDISEDDIAEARREMWSNFPREDI